MPNSRTNSDGASDGCVCLLICRFRARRATNSAAEIPDADYTGTPCALTVFSARAGHLHQLVNGRSQSGPHMGHVRRGTAGKHGQRRLQLGQLSRSIVCLPGPSGAPPIFQAGYTSSLAVARDLWRPAPSGRAAGAETVVGVRMSQLNAAALLAQIATAWVALFLLWQNWRDRRRAPPPLTTPHGCATSSHARSPTFCNRMDDHGDRPGKGHQSPGQIRYGECLVGSTDVRW